MDLASLLVSATSGTLKNKTKVITVKISAPKEVFLLTDALSKHGSFPSEVSFLEGKVASLLFEYVSDAEKLVTKASELSRSKQK